jgi:hypothetical protein
MVGECPIKKSMQGPLYRFRIVPLPPIEITVGY